jgi:hypothetical protein
VSGTVIFLNGPIGVGKTVLGRLVAAELDALFIDSDDLGDSSKRWFGQGLSTGMALVGAALGALRERPVVLVAKPLRARDWVFFKRRLEAMGATAYCITLAAGAEAILSPSRGREFDAEERARIGEMIAQGYGNRPFSDALVETDRAGLADTADAVAAACRSLIRSGRDRP